VAFVVGEFDEILDVRSPGEFALDHVPGAVNVPVLSDEERAKVGTIYKKNPFEGRKVGARLVTANVARHLGEFFNEKEKGYKPLVYCWRGGMRSNSMASVLTGVGWRTRVLAGGYKGWRSFVMKGLEELLEGGEVPFRVLAGLTGVGKTRLLDELSKRGAQVVDLEGLILGDCGEQPSQKLFESRLFWALANLNLAERIFVEAESNRIGEVHVPSALWQSMGRECEATEVFEVKMALEGRAKLLKEEYVHFWEEAKGEENLLALLQPLRRLRGHAVVEGWEKLIAAGDWMGFLQAILEEHYDEAYRNPGVEGCHYGVPEKVVNLGGTFEGGMVEGVGELLALE